ncbi:MAG: DNA repair protein RecO [Oscillospiraceae bacterium]|nr:DNA repair protein RecO [Oscillospiraceae bacterium]
MYINTKGIILRETAYKESSKILTILTGDQGKLTVSARGALRRGSKLAAATSLLVFSDMTLFVNRERWTLTEAKTIEEFRGLREDIEKLALASYIAELAEAVSDEDSNSPELLPLCLNTLFALSEGIREASFIKPAFELRLMALSGFAPLVTHCALCGKTDLDMASLDLSGGILTCVDCSNGEGIDLGSGAISAARYIISCEQKKLFSFSLGDRAQIELGIACEKYLLAQLERRFRTLEFYKQIIN